VIGRSASESKLKMKCDFVGRPAASARCRDLVQPGEAGSVAALFGHEDLVDEEGAAAAASAGTAGLGHRAACSRSIPYRAAHGAVVDALAMADDHARPPRPERAQDNIMKMKFKIISSLPAASALMNKKIT
jgi:hypothetical protein